MMGLADNIAKPGGKFTVQYHSGYGHAVYDPDGKRVGDFYKDAIQARASCAHKQRAADEAAKRIERPCMCCRAVFKSEGIHNRLCNACKGRSDALGDPVRPYIARKSA